MMGKMDQKTLEEMPFNQLLEYRNQIINQIDSLDDEIQRLRIEWNNIKMEILRRRFEEERLDVDV